MRRSPSPVEPGQRLEATGRWLAVATMGWNTMDSPSPPTAARTRAR